MENFAVWNDNFPRCWIWNGKRNDLMSVVLSVCKYKYISVFFHLLNKDKKMYLKAESLLEKRIP